MHVCVHICVACIKFDSMYMSKMCKSLGPVQVKCSMYPLLSLLWLQSSFGLFCYYAGFLNKHSGQGLGSLKFLTHKHVIDATFSIRSSFHSMLVY